MDKKAIRAEYKKWRDRIAPYRGTGLFWFELGAKYGKEILAAQEREIVDNPLYNDLVRIQAKLRDYEQGLHDNQITRQKIEEYISKRKLIGYVERMILDKLLTWLDKQESL